MSGNSRRDVAGGGQARKCHLRGERRQMAGRLPYVLGGPASPNLPLSQGQGPSSALSLIPGLSPALDS